MHHATRHMLLLIAMAVTRPAWAQSDEAPGALQRPRGEGEQAEELTEEERAELARFARPPLRDAFTWRVGPTFHGMFRSQQGRPLLYPGIGLRRKGAGGQLYLDLQLPALFGLIDAGQYLLQRDVIRASSALNLFETLNAPRHYVFAELAHARLGQRFDVTITTTPRRPARPLRLAAGVAGVADWVVLDAYRISDSIEDGEAFEDMLQRDPLVLGPGVFAAAGGGRGPVSWDLALEVARDLIAWEAYTPATGWVISLDLDAQADIIDNLGMYFRSRLALYTHLSSRAVTTTSVGTGISFRF